MIVLKFLVAGRRSKRCFNELIERNCRISPSLAAVEVYTKARMTSPMCLLPRNVMGFASRLKDAHRADLDSYIARAPLLDGTG